MKVTFESKDIKELKILIQELHKRGIRFDNYKIKSEAKQDLLLDLLDLTLWKRTSQIKEEFGKYLFVSLRTITRTLHRLEIAGRIERRSCVNADGQGRWFEWRLK